MVAGGQHDGCSLALPLASFPYLQRNEAKQQQQLAEAQKRETQKTELDFLSKAADAAYGNGRDWSRITNAALLALDGLPDKLAGVLRPDVERPSGN